MNKITTSVAEMHVDVDGILNIKIFPNVLLTLEKVKEYYIISKEIVGNKKALVLFDGSEEYSITEEAKFFGASKEVTDTRIAVAYITNSIANKLMFNLYLSVNKPEVPTKMFSSKENGLKWLKTFFVMPGDKFVNVKKKR